HPRTPGESVRPSTARVPPCTTGVSPGNDQVHDHHRTQRSRRPARHRTPRVRLPRDGRSPQPQPRLDPPAHARAPTPPVPRQPRHVLRRLRPRVPPPDLRATRAEAEAPMTEPVDITWMGEDEYDEMITELESAPQVVP